MNREHELPADLDNLIAGLRIENINLKLAAKQAEYCIREVAASLAWNCFGECRAVHDGPLMPAQGALEMARGFLASQQGEPAIGKSGYYSDQEWINAGCPPEHPEQAEGAQGDLKPCPFCGGQARLTYDDYVHEDMRPMPVVECTNCHTWVRAESWNNRAALAQPSPCIHDKMRAARKAAIDGLRSLSHEELLERAEQNAQPSPAPELEKQEPVAWFTDFPGHRIYAAEPHGFDELGCKLSGDSIVEHWSPLYAAPVAQAGQVPEGWKLVPIEPTKDQWGGLARAIVFWMRSYQSSKHTPATLIEFITSLGHEVPEWMGDEAELRTKDHVISKGTAAVLIYKAMLAAAPDQGGE